MDLPDFLLRASGGSGLARLARTSLLLISADDREVRLAVRIVLEQLFRNDAGTRMLAFAAAELGRARLRRTFASGHAVFIDLVRATCLSRIGRSDEARVVVDECRGRVRPMLAQRWVEVASLGRSVDPQERSRAEGLLHQIVEMENAFETMAFDASPAPSRRASGAVQRHGLVLVVDDDDDVRESIALLLEDSGFDVVKARSGAEAIAQIERGARPHAIILDLMMPVMNGWDFYEWQKSSPIAGTPTLVYTATGLRPGSLGPLRIVPKTIAATALVSAVTEAAAAR